MKAPNTSSFINLIVYICVLQALQSSAKSTREAAARVYGTFVWTASMCDKSSALYLPTVGEQTQGGYYIRRRSAQLDQERVCVHVVPGKKIKYVML